MEAPESQIVLRLADAPDRDGVAALIDSILREYGDRLCLEGVDADLLDIRGHYEALGGAFVVLELNGAVVGSHATLPLAGRPGICTFRRLYLERSLRGTRWGRALMQWAIDWARDHEMARVEFWSDTRFERAHRFFEGFGFQRDGRIRDMDDGYLPYREHFFYLDLIER